MNKYELQQKTSRIRKILYHMLEGIETLDNSPSYDEDYKIARFHTLTIENFERLEIHLNKASEHFERYFCNPKEKVN